MAEEFIVWGIGPVGERMRYVLAAAETVSADEVPQDIVGEVDGRTGGDWTEAWVVRVSTTEADLVSSSWFDREVLGYRPCAGR